MISYIVKDLQQYKLTCRPSAATAPEAEVAMMIAAEVNTSFMIDIDDG